MMNIRWCRTLGLLFALCLFGSSEAFAQTPTVQTPPAQTMQGATTAVVSDGRVPLTEAALSRGVAGDVLLAGTLRAMLPAGTPEAPTQNVRFIVENRSPVEYSYLSGRVTFYDAAGVRCSEGLFTANSLVPNERAEVDAPGLRLVCAPAAWRIVPIALVSGGTVVTPGVTMTANGSGLTNATLSPAPAPRLSIEINGTVMPVQLGNPIEVEVGGERVRIVVMNARP